MKRKQRIRLHFRQSVFKRDKHTCKGCNRTLPEDQLDAHHITDRSHFKDGGYILDNGITLCKSDCHIKAEKYHITNGEEWEEGYHPDQLYKLIGSGLRLIRLIQSKIQI